MVEYRVKAEQMEVGEIPHQREHGLGELIRYDFRVVVEFLNYESEAG